ncbi:amino acid ABC transporter permease [Magnetovibrio sp. PR-2]|uniref:amino acid ABC transporter permease n=1 Tax=Magnetovibrio sp. PR-2 TaxID=3120356 RepID=UPI002FCE48BD
MSDQTSRPQPSKTAIWNDPTFRSIAFQILAVLVLGWFFYTIFSNTLTNMERRGITTGFQFLDNTAGFGILMTLIEYDETHTYGRTFLVGLLNTALISFVGIVTATILGFIIGVARLSNNWLISKISAVYVETLRNIPLLLQIFFWYFAVLQALPHPRQSMNFMDSIFLNGRGLYVPGPVPESGFSIVMVLFFLGIVASYFVKRWADKRQDLTGEQFPTFWASLGMIFGIPLVAFFVLGMPLGLDYPALKGFNFQGGVSIIPEFMALWWALSLYTAAFIAEIVRAGIQGVAHGQSEAAHALGVRNAPTLRLVVVPQAMRIIIPPLTSQYLNLAKNSSLATAIGYPDLVGVFMGTTLNQTGQAVEIVAMTMAVYLTMSLLISGFMNWFNNKMALVER